MEKTRGLDDWHTSLVIGSTAEMAGALRAHFESLDA
jgi:hypothetical protein